MSRSVAIACVLISLGVSGCNKSPVEPGPDCTSAVAPATVTLSAAASTTTIAVTVASACSWSAQSQAGWLTITAGAAGQGSGAVTVAVSENADPAPRTGAVTVAGHAVSITQAAAEPAPCVYSISPESASFAANGGTGMAAVTTASGCAWTASSDAAWVTVDAGSSGSGAGTVAYTVSPQHDPATRTAALTIAGRTLTIVQQADTASCTYSVAPVDLSTCMAPTIVTTSISTQPSCGWTASASASWLALSQTSGSGAASIAMQLGENYDAPRQATLMIRWPTPTVGQNVRVNQAGCRYFVSSSAFAVAAAGAVHTVIVVQQSDPLECGGPTQSRCVWSAVAEVPWIVITTSMPQTGDGQMTFNVLPNTAGARSGVIRLRDQMIRIDQASLSLLQWQSRARRLLFRRPPEGL
ncbi:MAG TPA: BACON domain-containing carbohydrate-binding protein [Vicinamibacterales bacterium]|nr:BACON domain-containing carbohydrate-binding protein [Vicinamibacterales bacterium]